MSLLDDLRAAGASLDPQFQVSSNDIGPVLSGLVHYVEHGDKYLKAAQDEHGVGAVTELLAPQADAGDDKPAKASKGDK